MTAFKLEMFSDFICPFCYIGFATARRLQPEFGFELELRGFQIHPEWPAEGLALSQHPRMMDPKARRLIWTHILELAEGAGLTMRPPEVLANSRLALQAAEFARENGKGDQISERVYRAYFSEGLNIGFQGVLGDLGADVGLGRSELDRALESQRHATRFEHDTRLAHERGVNGVPAFFLGEYSFAGAQSESMMRDVMQKSPAVAVDQRDTERKRRFGRLIAAVASRLALRTPAGWRHSDHGRLGCEAARVPCRNVLQHAPPGTLTGNQFNASNQE